MRGNIRRYIQVIVRFLPFALAFLRDRRRFFLFGAPRRAGEEVHQERAKRITQTMLNLGPAFIKVGQVLSTRPDLVPPTYVEAFATLQDEVPEDAGGDPLTIVSDELGGKIDEETVAPVAGGSLAFVYTAEWNGERIALKVRRPDIVPVIERDIQVIRRLVPIVSLAADERQRYSLENLADDFETIILNEVDFDREATIMTEIRENLAEENDVVVPDVYGDLCTERIIAMEYVEGTKITQKGAFDSVDVDPTETATLIARTYLKMGLIDGVFHADPHPGNLAITPDGRLVIYDYGMSQRLTQREQDDITRLYRTLVRRDVDGLLNALIALEVLDPNVDRRAVRRVLEMVIETLEGESVITWRLIIEELFTMLHDFPFRIPPNVLLLLRVGTVGEGVCRSLDPTFDFIVVTRSFLADHGFIESELEALYEAIGEDLRRSIPVLAGIPARVDTVFEQMERGEFAVRTEPIDAPTRGDPANGYAILAGSLLVATAILTFHEQPYELASLILAIVVAGVYVRSRRRSV